MKEHKEFDDYIKGFFETDPEIPSELEWETMVFDLPEKPGNSSGKNGRKYFTALLVLFMIGPMIYFSIKKQNTVKLNSSSIVTEQSSNEEITKKAAKEMAKPENVAAAVSNEETEPTLLKSALPVEDKLLTIEPRVNQQPEKVPANKTENDVSPSIVKKSQDVKQTSTGIVQANKPKTKNTSQITKTIKETKHSKTKEPVDVNQSLEYIRNKPVAKENLTKIQSIKPSKASKLKDDFPQISLTNNKPVVDIKDNIIEPFKIAVSTPKILRTSGIEKSFDSIIEPLTNIWKGKLSKPLDLEIKLERKPALVEKNELEPENNFKINEVYAGYGYSHFYLDISELGIIKYIINSVPSNFYKAGIKLNLGKKWMTNTGLRFDRYHTTLEYTRDLEPIYRESQKINRKEVTFHNNFTNTIGLQMGIARKWNSNKRLHFYTGVGIMPNYTMSATGKTVIDLIADQLVYDEGVNKLSINAGLAVGLVYKVSPAFNVELAYEYSQFFKDGIFINNGIAAKEQGSFSVNISYKLNNK